MTKASCLMCIGGICLTVVLVAQTDFASVYSDIELQAAAGTYATNLQGMWREDLVLKVPTKDQAQARDIRLNAPLRGRAVINQQVVASNSPFTYYADVMNREVTIPILSVKFLDDLATAVAWLDTKHCNQAWVFDYVDVIRSQDPVTWPGGRFPTPLVALRTPKNVLDNAVVRDVSGKLLKSAIYFMMAHELAHVLYGHEESAPGAAGQAREMAADGYALDVMQSIGVAPAGMTILFLAASRFDPVRSDYKTLADYETQVRRTNTHPLSGARLNAIAKRILNNLKAFATGEPNPAAVEQVAREIEGIAIFIEDDTKVQSERKRSRGLTALAFAQACP